MLITFLARCCEFFTKGNRCIIAKFVERLQSVTIAYFWFLPIIRSIFQSPNLCPSASAGLWWILVRLRIALGLVSRFRFLWHLVFQAMPAMLHEFARGVSAYGTIDDFVRDNQKFVQETNPLQRAIWVLVEGLVDVLNDCMRLFHGVQEPFHGQDAKCSPRCYFCCALSRVK